MVRKKGITLLEQVAAQAAIHRAGLLAHCEKQKSSTTSRETHSARKVQTAVSGSGSKSVCVAVCAVCVVAAVFRRVEEGRAATVDVRRVTVAGALVAAGRVVFGEASSLRRCAIS